MIGKKIKGVYDWGGNGKEKERGVKKTPEVIKDQKGLESICYFNIQISKARYPSLIPWKTDIPKFDACTHCEYSVIDGYIRSYLYLN